MSKRAKVIPLQAQALVLRIELLGITPTIYRTIVVPASITLPKLHVTILRAMGWQGGHLHEFMIDGLHYGQPDPDFPEPDLKPEQRVRLDKALGLEMAFGYIYDYGDNWQHGITVLGRIDLRGRMTYPQCLEGANACPPEDVGGVPGYEDFVAAMADPTHPEHDHLRQWYGQPYDPTAFDLHDAQERLAEIKL